MAKNFSMTFDTLSSNDILGISYLKALQNTNIIPYTIKRTNQYHDTDLAQSIASATAILRKGYLTIKIYRMPLLWRMNLISSMLFLFITL